MNNINDYFDLLGFSNYPILKDQHMYELVGRGFNASETGITVKFNGIAADMSASTLTLCMNQKQNIMLKL